MAALATHFAVGAVGRASPLRPRRPLLSPAALEGGQTDEPQEDTEEAESSLITYRVRFPSGAVRRVAAAADATADAVHAAAGLDAGVSLFVDEARRTPFRSNDEARRLETRRGAVQLFASPSSSTVSATAAAPRGAAPVESFDPYPSLSLSRARRRAAMTRRLATARRVASLRDLEEPAHDINALRPEERVCAAAELTSAVEGFAQGREGASYGKTGVARAYGRIVAQPQSVADEDDDAPSSSSSSSKKSVVVVECLGPAPSDGSSTDADAVAKALGLVPVGCATLKKRPVSGSDDASAETSLEPTAAEVLFAAGEQLAAMRRSPRIISGVNNNNKATTASAAAAAADADTTSDDEPFPFALLVCDAATGAVEAFEVAPVLVQMLAEDGVETTLGASAGEADSALIRARRPVRVNGDLATTVDAAWLYRPVPVRPAGDSFFAAATTSSAPLDGVTRLVRDATSATPPSQARRRRSKGGPGTSSPGKHNKAPHDDSSSSTQLLDALADFAVLLELRSRLTKRDFSSLLDAIKRRHAGGEATLPPAFSTVLAHALLIG